MGGDARPIDCLPSSVLGNKDMTILGNPVPVNRKPLCAAILGGIVSISAPALLAATASMANPCAARRSMVVASSTNPCNPCSTKKACNPCNPCAVKNACSPCNPCAARKACNPCNPCGAKKACNPCNPCSAAKVSAKDFIRPKGTRPASGNRVKLAAEGERLWTDIRLSTNGLSCNSCHANNAALNPTFAQPYPHRVAMPSQMAGAGKVSAEEMAQFCLLVPMQSKTLPWESRELAALAAYTVALQKTFKPNPCAAKNPCNPCNPCAARKPCSPCNPCAIKKNPCNPCKPCNPCAVQKSN